MTSTLSAMLFSLALTTPLPVAAHAILIDSMPAPRASAPAGPVALWLHYNSRIDQKRSRLALVGPDGGQTRLAVSDDGPADTLSANATLTPGSYVVRWQVLATDGHITRGELPFTVAAP